MTNMCIQYLLYRKCRMGESASKMPMQWKYNVEMHLRLPIGMNMTLHVDACSNKVYPECTVT